LLHPELGPLQTNASEKRRKSTAKGHTSHQIVHSALENGRGVLSEHEAGILARKYGISVARGQLATSEKEALRIARKIGYPVVMKISSPEIPHKHSAGGVIVGVEGPGDVIRAYREIRNHVRRVNRDAVVDGVFIQEMDSNHYEFAVGGIRDPEFGPVVMFGLGGTYIELVDDVSFRLAPLTMEEAISMTEEIRAASLLTGNSKRLDVPAVAKTILSVGMMISQIPEIESVDINPLLVHQRGVKAVDIRVSLKKNLGPQSGERVSLSRLDFGLSSSFSPERAP
jgi:succinyl-CoA synthetase beta subunit